MLRILNSWHFSFYRQIHPRVCSLWIKESFDRWRATTAVASSIDNPPFSALKSSIDQLWLRDENLIPNDFIYEDMLKVDDNIAVMGGLITDEEIVQYTIEVLEEEVQEDAEETNETLTKPTTEEIPKAIDTLVSFSMFTGSRKIGKIAMKTSTLFEKELSESMKQKSVSDFFK